MTPQVDSLGIDPSAFPDFEDWMELRSIYSNFLHELDVLVAQQLRDRADKCYAMHYAWNFCSTIWFSILDGKYHAGVKQYHCVVAHYASESIQDLIKHTNDTYGHD